MAFHPPVLFSTVVGHDLSALFERLEAGGMRVEPPTAAATGGAVFAGISEHAFYELGVRHAPGMMPVWDFPEPVMTALQHRFGYLKGIVYNIHRTLLQSGAWLRFLGRDAPGTTDLFPTAMTRPWGWAHPFNPVFQAAWRAVFPSLKFVWIEDDARLAASILHEEFQDKVRHIPDLTFAPDTPFGVVSESRALGLMEVFDLRDTDYAGARPRFTLRCATPEGAEEVVAQYAYAARHLCETLAEGRALKVPLDAVLSRPEETAERILGFATSNLD